MTIQRDLSCEASLTALSSYNLSDNACLSHVILHSFGLPFDVARNKWLSATFPKFSAKTRGGKPPQIVPPPHTIKAHGRYDLTIGPHTFPKTAIYEVHYTPQAPAPVPTNFHAPLYNPPASLYLNSSFPESHQVTYMQQSIPPVTDPGTPSMQPLTTPPTPATDSYVTPSLISQVNAASMSNPALANLLQLAASGRATSDQLKTLGLLIQSLGTIQPPEAQAGPSSSEPSHSAKEFDIVLEFQEKPSDRWIFPRGTVVLERVESGPLAAQQPDVLLQTIIPFPDTLYAVSAAPSESNVADEPITVEVPPHIVTFRLARVSRALWDLLVVWSGGEHGIEDSKRRLGELSLATPERTYLQHQLPEGPLLSQVQIAVAPSYSTRPIGPGHADSSRPKRKASSRKAVANFNNSSSVAGEKGPPAKQRLSSKPKVITPPPIACHSCGQTDVPLMMGGRYCRACIDAGKAVNDIPQIATTNARTTATTVFKAYEVSLPSSADSTPAEQRSFGQNAGQAPRSTLLKPSPAGTHPPVLPSIADQQETR
ncbi:hypothetical protein AcW1_000981 [Taiwanofungus camphoratus]|nr:hypothetical protein AcW1_000981 [Antrodia cinnamomea]